MCKPAWEIWAWCDIWGLYIGTTEDSDVLKWYVMCTCNVVRHVLKRERTQDGRHQLAASALKMTYLYPITSDTTEKDNKICNVWGPRAPLPDCRAPVICTGFPSRQHIVRLIRGLRTLRIECLCTWCCRSLLDDLQQMLDPQGFNVDVTRQAFETAMKDWTEKVKNKVNVSW